MSDLSTRFLSDFHFYRWLDGVEVELDQFRDAREFSARMTALWRPDPEGESVLLHRGRVNFDAPTTVSTLAKNLAHRHPAVAQETWHDRLLLISYQSAEAYEEGSSHLVAAPEIEVDYDAPPDLIPGLIAGHGVTLHYGDGAAGKSTFALACGLAVATASAAPLGLLPLRYGPVITFDWEDGKETWKERLEALCTACGLPVPATMLHREMDRSVVAGETRIRREVEERGAVLAIFDSVGEMLGGDPSDPALVIAAVNVMKRLGIPALGIHHLSGEQAASKDLARKQKPYGSVYARSGARMMWLLERFQEEDSDVGVIYAHNTKVNRGRKRSRMSWTVEYENSGNEHLSQLRYSPRSAADYFERIREDIADADLTVRDAILRVLETGRGDAYTYEGLQVGVQRLLSRDVALSTIRGKVGQLVREGVLSRWESAETGKVLVGLASHRGGMDEPAF